MTEAPYSVNFTPGRPPMITVRADSAKEWTANLQAAADSGALTMIKGINETLNGQPKAAAARPTAVTPSATSAPSSQAGTSGQELPSGFGTPKCVECDEETRFDKAGVSTKSGKPYKRFLCTDNPTHKATFTS